MRVLYYALGGGLGHLVRARAVLHTLAIDDAAILTASPHARDARVTGDVETLLAPRELERDARAWRDWLDARLRERRPDVLCLDAFPAGILGELCEWAPPPGVALWHVARLLRWPMYTPLLRGDVPRFARVLRVEALAPEQQRWLDARGVPSEDLALRDPPAAASAAAVPATPYWLIVHSGPAAEVAHLIAYADELRTLDRAEVRLLVISADAPATLPRAAEVLDAFPATPYFAAAQRIFSAAGFNVLRQAAPFRAKHEVLPQPRRFDDQFARAVRYRALAG